MQVEVTHVEVSREIGGAFSSYTRVDSKLIRFVINGDYDYAIGVHDPVLGLVTPGEGLRNISNSEVRHSVITEVLKQSKKWMLTKVAEKLNIEMELADVLSI